MIPVLWLCGPPGAGKTAVGWEVYSSLLASGTPAAYVDIDQLGICYPEPADDPGRHRMKARNLAAVVANHRAGGAGCVVVSGVVDTVAGPAVDELPHAAVTVCRLRADGGELAARLLGRDGPAADVADSLREAADLDAGGVGGVCVDTTGRTVPEVAALVRERTGGWPGPVRPGRGPVELPTVDAPLPVVWLCGPTGVGTSTVGFQVYLRMLASGRIAAYVDLGQLGFGGPGPAAHRVKAANAAALVRTFRAAGAQAVVMVGPVDDATTVRLYAGALRDAAMAVYRLHAGRDELARRILRRGEGRGSWPQPGDPLRGRPAAELLGVVDRAARHAEALDRAGTGHRVDTDGLAPDEVTDLIVRRLRWLS